MSEASVDDRDRGESWTTVPGSVTKRFPCFLSDGVC